MNITKDMTIAEILKANENSVSILQEAGMHCLGCPSAQSETLEEACIVHNLNDNELLQKLNEVR